MSKFVIMAQGIPWLSEPGLPQGGLLALINYLKGTARELRIEEVDDYTDDIDCILDVYQVLPKIEAAIRKEKADSVTRDVRNLEGCP